ncbi:MAG: hypothetical protein ACYTGL_24875 [Planctomycetota bacterium]
MEESARQNFPVRTASQSEFWLRCVAYSALTLTVLAGWHGLPPAARADEHFNGFNTGTPSWSVSIQSPAEARLRVHRRNLFTRLEGEAAENMEIDALRSGATIRLEHQLPKSAPIDDLKLSVAYRSNNPGALLAMRLVFPGQKNPQTGKTLTALLFGNSYTATGQWQSLTVNADKRLIRQRLARLRSELRTSEINDRGVYIDRAVILMQLKPGTTEVFLDDLKWTGYAPPATLPTSASIIQQTAGAESNASSQRRFEMRLDRLLIDGRPIIPRFTLHHGESLSRLRDVGINLIWIDDYQDTERLREIRGNGMWAMATPPQGRINAGPAADSIELSLDTFDRSADGILFWYLGTRIPGSPAARERLETQIRLVRGADRNFGRPVIADIGGYERPYSRLLDGVGLSRHPLQTEFSLHSYRRFLTQKYRQMRPGTFVTTWIQTESAPDLSDGLHAAPLIEPELIRLQAFAAIAAGYQGIGFWKRTSLEGEFAGARERELAIAITNEEIALLEPWLATRTITDFQRVPVSTRSGATSAARSRKRRLALPGLFHRDRPASPAAIAASFNYVRDQVELTMIHGPNGLLLLPVWYQRDSQFVPGQMASRSVSLTIPGVPDTATVWRVSTTDVRTVERTPGVGGVQVQLDDFDQIAALVVSTDPNWGRILRDRITSRKLKNASLWVELAERKLKRVQATNDELQELGVVDSQAPALMATATQLIDAARKALTHLQEAERSRDGRVVAASFSQAGGDAHAVRTWCEMALQSLRQLQRSQWETAVGESSSPLSSPYTISYNTLPDHWRFLRRLGGSSAGTSDNLLSGGDFEYSDTGRMIEAGWKHWQDEIDGVRAAAELVPSRSGDGLALRLLAVPEPNTVPELEVAGAPIAVRTPQIDVPADSIVHVSGRIRLPVRPDATLDGVTLTESLTGARLSWTNATNGWQSFELIREVDAPAIVTLTLTLHGYGDVFFDDLRVVTTPRSPLPTVQASTETDSSASKPGALRRTLDRTREFLNALPGRAGLTK